jgi:hypothetical protein
MSAPFITLDHGRIRAGVDQAKGRLREAGQVTLKAATRGMVLFAEDLVSQAQENLENQTRSGDLKASGTVGDVQATNDGLELPFGFNKEYGAQVDQGGTIKPKKGRMLAIPLGPILTGRGVPRYKSPREEPDLQLVVLAGKVFLVKKVARKSGERRFADFHWLLVPEVNQKGSGYFSRVVTQNAPKATEVVGREIQKDLNAAGGSNG